MKIIWSVILIAFFLSCTSTKKSSESSDHTEVTVAKNSSLKKKSVLNLPVCLNFTPNQPNDSVVKIIQAFFNDKNIEIISKEKMSDLIQVEMKSAIQNTRIQSGSSPESMLKQFDSETKAVSNHLHIDFSFIKKGGKTFTLKWHNRPMPFRFSNIQTAEWFEIDSKLVSKYPWPESLKIAVELIIISGKLE